MRTMRSPARCDYYVLDYLNYHNQEQASHLNSNYAQQQELYNKYKAGKGGKAASPGGSWHNYGVAVDVTIYRPDGSWDDGRKGDSNYTGRARSAFKPFRMKNTVPNDMGHFYPAEFAIEIPQAVRTGKKSVTDFAREKGIDV